jgi:lysophospholipase L1-like esterase
MTLFTIFSLSTHHRFLKHFGVASTAAVWLTFFSVVPADGGKPVPANLFNIGDSIGEGNAADGTIGKLQHDAVWSTGYNAYDPVFSLNERFEAADSTSYFENNATRDIVLNHAVSGSKMDDFVEQANEVVAAADLTPDKFLGLLTILLGNNDVCADSLEDMTAPEQFESQFRAGLDVLAASRATKKAYIHVSSIPAIYWLWNSMRENNWCRVFAWPFVPCQNLLSNPDNDCGAGDSHLNPDNIHVDDGPNCIRRKLFHAKIRDIYNPILKKVLQEYVDTGRLPNAYYVDIFDIQFAAVHVNDGDCFHPSLKGHALMAEIQWCRSPWGRYDESCGRLLPAPWIPLLLLDD